MTNPDRASKFDLTEAFDSVAETWTPHIAAELAGCHLKLARLEGEFTWHAHPEADEVFIVVAGELTIELREGALELGPGQAAFVPAGTEHRPVADGECRVLLLEPAGTKNTGDADDPREVEESEWLDADLFRP